MKNDKTENFDVIIVGTGPSESFAALTLAEKGRHVLMLEKGLELKTGFA